MCLALPRHPLFLCIQLYMCTCLHRWYGERGVSVILSLAAFNQHKICCVYHKISWLCICLSGVETRMQYANTVEAICVNIYILEESFHMPFHHFRYYYCGKSDFIRMAVMWCRQSVQVSQTFKHKHTYFTYYISLLVSSECQWNASDSTSCIPFFQCDEFMHSWTTFITKLYSSDESKCQCSAGWSTPTRLISKSNNAWTETSK